MTGAPLGRRLLAEPLGSAFLAAVVIGSGIAARHLSPGDTGLELLENAAATLGLIRVPYPGITPAQAAETVIPHAADPQDRPSAAGSAAAGGLTERLLP